MRIGKFESLHIRCLTACIFDFGDDNGKLLEICCIGLWRCCEEKEESSDFYVC